MSEAASPTGLSKTSMVVPIANVSTLSQAWIDALGLARHQAVAPSTASPKNTVAATVRMPDAMPARRVQTAHPQELAVQPKSKTGKRALRMAPGSRDRIADVERMRVSKKVASIHPPQPDVFRRSAGRITIISRKGIIRLLMQRDAHQLRITAVCDPRLVSTITDSLNASRVAMAARGLTLHANTHSSEKFS